ncbi:hypothetical protein WAI453_007202 [Rhynchosporium graminicola]
MYPTSRCNVFICTHANLENNQRSKNLENSIILPYLLNTCCALTHLNLCVQIKTYTGSQLQSFGIGCLSDFAASLDASAST